MGKETETLEERVRGEEEKKSVGAQVRGWERGSGSIPLSQDSLPGEPGTSQPSQLMGSTRNTFMPMPRSMWARGRVCFIETTGAQRLTTPALGLTHPVKITLQA